MSRLRIPVHPIVTDTMRSDIANQSEVFFSSRLEKLGTMKLSADHYSFGSESGWNPAEHDFEIKFRFHQPKTLAALFGAGGIIPRHTGLLMGLEWTSKDMARRGLASKREIYWHELEETQDSFIDFQLKFPPGAVRGSITMSLQLFIGTPGVLAAGESHLANTQGFRLGSISRDLQLTFDGDGSLFPIVEVDGGSSDSLWELHSQWEDPTEDEFSSDYLSLSINRKHPHFKDLRGKKAPYQTPLFSQVLSSWITLWLLKLREDSPDTWRSIEVGDQTRFLPGSIAAAASYVFSRGELRAGSSAQLMKCTQEWVDRQLHEKREDT